MELKHSERRQLGERGRREGGEPDLRPLLHEPRQVQEHERLRGPGQVRAGHRRDKLRVPDQRLGKACVSVPAHEPLPKDEAALHGHRSVMVRIFEPQNPLHAMAEANLNAGKSKDLERGLSALSAAVRAKAIEVMGQLGKLETRPSRQDPGVRRPAPQASSLPSPDGARKEKCKIKGVPKKAVTNVRHLEYREVLEEGSERRATFAQLRSRARARSPWRRPRRSQLAPARTLAQPGAAADAGRLRSARLRALRPRG